MTFAHYYAKFEDCSMPPIRVIIVDDHPVLRQGMKTFLQTSSRIEVIAEAATGYEAMTLVNTLQPDILILDANLPDCEGVEIAEALQKREAAVRVLVLSAHDDLDYVRRFTAAGVVGYLLKEEASCLILQAVEAVAQGETGWFSHRIQQQLHTLTQAVYTSPTLTAREAEVVRHLAEGKTSYAIGQTLNISAKTVEKHLDTIYRKLGVRSRTEAVVMAMRDDLI
jgi:two-component system, NarL family, nitrate/nitrite response regulator NarL